MPEARAVAGTSLSDEVHSAFTVLGADEYRRWQESCHALEGTHEYPWAEPESRALVTSVLGCLFGESLNRLDTPARDWARTSSTMAVFARRLGCLRELIGQEGVLNGPEATLRAHQIFDRVTIVGTEAALASLTYGPDASVAASVAPTAAIVPETTNMAVTAVTPPSELVGTEETLDQEAVAGTDGTVEADEVTIVVPALAEDGRADEVHTPRLRRRTIVVLIAAALIALAASLVFALSPSSTRHPIRSHNTSTGGTTATAPTGSNGRTGGGSGSTSGGRVSTNTGRGSAGSIAPGTGGPSGGSTGGGSGNSGGSGSPPGGSTGLTLPGGIPVTVPNVSVPTGTSPKVTAPTGPQVTVPGLTLPGG